MNDYLELILKIFLFFGWMGSLSLVVPKIAKAKKEKEQSLVLSIKDSQAYVALSSVFTVLVLIFTII